MALYQSIIALIYLVSLTTTAQPPAPGTPNSFPQKSALAKKELFTPKETKSSSIENSGNRKVKFGANKVCTFEANDNEDEKSKVDDDSYVPFVFPSAVELPFSQGAGITMPNFSVPPSFLTGNPFAVPIPQLNVTNPFAFPQPSSTFMPGMEHLSTSLDTGLENSMQSMHVTSNFAAQNASFNPYAFRAGADASQGGSLFHSSAAPSSIQFQPNFPPSNTSMANERTDVEYDEDFVKIDDSSLPGSYTSENSKADAPLVPHPPSDHRPPAARPTVLKGSEKVSASDNASKNDGNVPHTAAPPQLQSFVSPHPPQWSAQPPFAESQKQTVPAFQSQSLQQPPQIQLQQPPFFAASQSFPAMSQPNAISFPAPSGLFQNPSMVPTQLSSAPSTSFPPTLTVNTSNFNIPHGDGDKKGGASPKATRTGGVNDSTHSGGSASPTSSYQQLSLNKHSSKNSQTSEERITVDEDTNSSAGLRGVQRCSFNWQLCFFRWTNLANVVETLEAVLNDGMYD